MKTNWTKNNDEIVEDLMGTVDEDASWQVYDQITEGAWWQAGEVLWNHIKES